MNVGDFYILRDSFRICIAKILSVSKLEFQVDQYSITSASVSHETESYRLSDLCNKDEEICDETYFHIASCYENAMDKLKSIVADRDSMQVSSIKVGDVIYMEVDGDEDLIIRVTECEPVMRFESLTCEGFFTSIVNTGVMTDVEGCFLMPSDSFDKLLEISKDLRRKCQGIVQAFCS